MTTKEFNRLKFFIKNYGDDEILSHSFLITQEDKFGINHDIKKQKYNLKGETFLETHYKQIKKLSLYISTRYGTFYF
jgi:hypothetical protein